MRRARRRKREDPVNHERWLVSYADFITLLFAFFTTLYAISVIDQDKGKRLVQSIRESFGEGIFEAGTTDPRILQQWLSAPIDFGANSGNGSANSERTRFNLVEQRTQALSANTEAGEGISVRRTEEGLVISLADTQFFEPGTSRVAPAARLALREVAGLLKDLPNHVRVEGHTDDRPVRGGGASSNWHLSATRAVEVVREFEQAGLASYRLSASGFADQRPLVSNRTDQGRRVNRRVDIVILRSRMSEEDA